MTQKISQPNIRQAGFTLIEILVSMILSILLLSSLMQSYLTIRADERWQIAVAELQDNGRFALSQINYLLAIHRNPLCHESLPPHNTYGYSHQQLSGYWQSQVALGDLIVVKRCQVHNHQSHIVSLALYLGDTGRYDSLHHKIFALYKKTGTKRREALIDGLAKIHISFLANHEQQFLTANHIKQWQSIIAVHLELLVRSLQPVLAQPQRYWFNHQFITATDHYYYQDWQTTINVRQAPVKAAHPE